MSESRFLSAYLPDDIIDLADTLPEILGDFLTYSEAADNWKSRYTPDLSDGERAWLDVSEGIYFNRYDLARQRLVHGGHKMLFAAERVGVRMPLFETMLKIAGTSLGPDAAIEAHFSPLSHELLEEIAEARHGVLKAEQLGVAEDARRRVSASQEKWVSVSDASLALDVPRSTISTWCARGKVEFKGAGRQRRINLNTLAERKKFLDRKRC